MNVKKGLLCAILILGVTSSAFSHNAKSSTTAVMLGFVFPTGGQIYNEQYTKALSIWGGFVAFGIVGGTARYHDDKRRIAGYLGVGGLWVFSIFDAARTADKINMDSHRRFGVTPTISPDGIGTMLSYRF